MKTSRTSVAVAAFALSITAAPAALAAAPPSPFPGAPTPAVIATALTPTINAQLVRNRFTMWRFAKAVCAYTGHRGMYLCAARHVAHGTFADTFADGYTVTVVGKRWAAQPSSCPPLPSGVTCVNSNTFPLTETGQ